MRVLVTGGAGFIGSALIARLNAAGIDEILIVDNLGVSEKWRNLVGLRFCDYRHKSDLLVPLERGELGRFDAICHLGACSSTVETDADYLMENNVRYTKRLADWALEHGVRFVYASSAATYGDGAQGFSDDDSVTPTLRPLNRYGYSKHLFDLHALRTGLVSRIAGVKFFNVFGPNEYHKDFMASVVYKSFHQVQETGQIELFRSHRDGWGDGGQTRDFLYVKDAVDALFWLLRHPEANGLFNLGTGRARSWNDLARAVFAAMERPEAIVYIDMPENLRDKYQYHTEAQMQKLAAAGCPLIFRTLEESVADYVRHYLARGPAHLTGDQ